MEHGVNFAVFAFDTNSRNHPKLDDSKEMSKIKKNDIWRTAMILADGLEERAKKKVGTVLSLTQF